MRKAEVRRDTKETKIGVKLNLDGKGKATIETGVPFLDHMLDQVARHGGLDLTVRAKGDLEIDAHHTVEDIGITLGQAFAKALGDKKGIRRYGHAYVPLDEALKGRGILVKSLHGSHPLLANCLRLTVGTADENAKLIEALASVLSHA